jgi:hypothetical protein
VGGVPFGQPAPDAVCDPVAEGVLQARLTDRALRTNLPRGAGRLAALGIEQIKVGAVARSLQPPARGETRRGSQIAVPRQAARHRAGRGYPRPPGSGESGQVGDLQAAGRELLGEPPGIPAGGLAGAAAHHGVRQRPGNGQPPYCLAGDTEPLRELPSGQEIGAVLNFDRNRGSRWGDERCG